MVNHAHKYVFSPRQTGFSASQVNVSDHIGLSNVFTDHFLWTFNLHHQNVMFIFTEIVHFVFIMLLFLYLYSQGPYGGTIVTGGTCTISVFI